jgi:UDP-N-acetylglucosamine 2-epimerase (non-hydrolysing)
LKKLKVVTIVGTRPEIIRLSRLIPKLDEYTDHILVHTGQNSDPKLNEVFFADLELRTPDYFLNVDTSSMGSVMGDVLKKSEEVFLKEKPDAVMILGDTNSSIAAIVAERMHIPVYHMEAGNRSFDNNVPEELNRKMVDHVASFNLPYNDYSMRNLLAEGIHPRFIQKTGSPIREIYKHYKDKIAASTAVEDLGLTANGYFLVSVHRQENVDLPERLEKVLDCLVAVRDHWNLPVLVSTHPRTRVRLEALNRSGLEGIAFHEPFGYLDYNKLQLDAKVVISDSGTISEESSIAGFKAVSLRDSIERPEALEAGSMIIAGLDPATLINSLELELSNTFPSSTPEGYSPADFSGRVLKFILSTAIKHKNWKNLRGQSS